MPVRTHSHFHFETLATKVMARELDDDARSDLTLEYQDHHFGAPLERFHDADDYESKDFHDQEDHIELLRGAQDRDWLEAQEETKEAFGIDPALSVFPDPHGALESVRRQIPSSMVTFKKIEVGTSEFNLLEYLNDDCNRDDLWNHSVPVIDIVENEGEALVMMLRLRHYASPPFQNVAECLDFIRQLLEGVAFFHEHKITRLNLCQSNIGMDTGLLPVTAANWDRSEYHVRYHLIDFSTALHYHGKEAAKGEMGAPGWMTREMTELDELSQFLPDDIKALGQTLQDIFQDTPELSFLSGLLCSMTARCPTARPTAIEALATLDGISPHLAPEVLFQSLAGAN